MRCLSKRSKLSKLRRRVWLKKIKHSLLRSRTVHKVRVILLLWHNWLTCVTTVRACAAQERSNEQNAKRASSGSRSDGIFSYCCRLCSDRDGSAALRPSSTIGTSAIRSARCDPRGNGTFGHRMAEMADPLGGEEKVVFKVRLSSVSPLPKQRSCVLGS